MFSSKNYMKSCSYFSVLWNTSCKLQNIVSVSFKITGIYFKRAVILLKSKLDYIPSHFKTYCSWNHPTNSCYEPAWGGCPSFQEHHVSPCFPKLILKAASEALACFFQCALLLPTTGLLCLSWPSPLVHSVPLPILHILIFQVFQLQ